MRRSRRRLLVLGALSDRRAHYGLDLARATRLRPGRLYPALDALEREGTVASFWQEGPPPRRRMYRLADR